MQIGLELSRFVTRSLDVTTSLDADGAVAKAAVVEALHLGSPLNAVSAIFGMTLPGTGHVKLPTDAFDVTAPRGSQLHQTVRMFEWLGAAHGVAGVDLPSVTFGTGGIRREPGGIAIKGGDYNGVGHHNATSLTLAARDVIKALGLI